MLGDINNILAMRNKYHNIYSNSQISFEAYDPTIMILLLLHDNIVDHILQVACQVCQYTEVLNRRLSEDVF